MGQTKKTLATKFIGEKSIFSDRFVIEVCESVHIHYRNLRLSMPIDDWIAFAEGHKDALSRWESRGKPDCSQGLHIELCRRVVGHSREDTARINLNANLYALNEGKIYAEGAGLKESEYVHVKIRDIRLEMTLDEFKILATAFREAEDNLCNPK